MANPEDEKQNLLLSDINPSLLLQGETPRIIDEWQIAPKLWDTVRFEVDYRNKEGQFLITGSAVLVSTENIVHSGTGRVALVVMRPMILYESKDSNGNVSLKELFTTPKQISGICDMDISKLAFLVCRGGWPRLTFMEDEIALEQAFDYYDEIVHADISRVDEIIRDSERVKRLMRSYARNQGQQVSNEVLKQDMIVNDNNGLECDAVIHLRNGNYGLIEIKLGGDALIEEGAKTLIKLSNKIDTTKMKKPSFLLVLIGVGNYAYVRKDGVYVVPVGCLKD